MLVLDRASRTVKTLPRLTQVGIAGLIAGLAIDVLAHVGWSSAMAAGHLVTLGGMVLALAGVLGLAFRRPDGPSIGGGR